MEKQYFVYIATNSTNRVLYTGVTNNLVRRSFQHKERFISSFTSKYKITKLVYYEIYNDIKEAVKREKQLKGGLRKKKIDLIRKVNPDFNDLYEEIIK